MNRRARCVRLIVALSLALFVFACGGGGGDVALGGGTSGTGIVQGSVTAFGSVFVRGIEFQVAPGAVYVDGDRAPRGQADLAVGMLVTVKGNWDDATGEGTAREIRYESTLDGPLAAAPDTSSGTFRVLGNTVAIDGDTVIEDSDGSALALADLQKGNVVEVSGSLSPDGTLRATRVERTRLQPGNGDQVKVKGIVSGLDTGAGTFQLGSLTVDYRAAGMPDNLSDGRFVSVKGALSGSAIVKAGTVDVESRSLGGRDGQRGDIEGYVTATASQSGFTLNGQEVGTTAQTRFVAGDAADVHVGSKLTVKGRFDAAGTLVADRVRIERQSVLQIDDTVMNVDPGTDTLTTLLGIKVHVSATTSLQDNAHTGDRSFNFPNLFPNSGAGDSDLSSGDRVEIRGVLAADGIEATRLRVTKPAEGCLLRGPVTDVNRSTDHFTVLGVDVDASGPGLPAGLAVNSLVRAWTTDPSGCTTSGLAAQQVTPDG